MVYLTGSTAFVTGAANGIGRATAACMAQSGAKVALVDVDAGRLNSLAEELGPQTVAIVSDIFSANGRSAAIQKTVDTIGPPDILVNCVGGSTGLSKASLALDEMTEDQWDSMIEFNLKGTFLCCKDLIPIMKRLGKGVIINMSSISGRWNTVESGVAYATAKAGLVGFTRRLAAELAPFGIRCNAVAPGYVMTDRIRQHLWDPASSSEKVKLIDRIPLGRLADPAEIAALVSFLASGGASYLTGTTIDCNGGIVSP